MVKTQELKPLVGYLWTNTKRSKTSGIQPASQLCCHFVLSIEKELFANF